MEFKRDCKSFPGVYACEVMTAEGQEDCKDCMFYEPISKKILMIKLGAMGDVLRTTPLLPALKKKYGHDSHITWLVKEESLPLLQKNPYIDKILVYNPENVLKLKYEKFNILINLDIEQAATLTANEVKAEEKYGFYLHEDGYPKNFNKAAEFYLHRIFSNYISKDNRKNYQEMMFEVAELKYNKEPIILKNIDENYAEKFLKENKSKKEDKILGINVGSAGRWPSKAWHQDLILDFIKKVGDDYKVLLLGGPEEKELIPQIIKRLEEIGIRRVMHNYQENSISEFASIINLCDNIITGDTLALHIATALNKKVIALFFCTPPWEIESYNNVEKITSRLFEKNFYTDVYNEELVRSISPEQVIEAMNNG